MLSCHLSNWPEIHVKFNEDTVKSVYEVINYHEGDCVVLHYFL